MDVDQVVLLGRLMLQEVIILAGPILVVAICVSLVVNIVQVLTSLQDTTISTVTRLVATGGALFYLDAMDVASPCPFHPFNLFRFSCVPEMIEIPLHYDHHRPAHHRRAALGTHAVRAFLWQPW